VLRNVLVLFFIWRFVSTADATSATWSTNPANGDWNTASNWSPANVPNGDADEANFAASSITDLSLSDAITVGGVSFTAGAASYMITVPLAQSLTLADRDIGISNSSNRTQTFVAQSGTGQSPAFIEIQGDVASSARNPIVFISEAPTVAGGIPGYFQCLLNGYMGGATVISQGGEIAGGRGGEVDFFNAGSAGKGAITSEAATVAGATGGISIFWMDSTAQASTVTANGASVSSAQGGLVRFIDQSHAGRASLTANGGTNGGEGGVISFENESSGGRARVLITGNATLDISAHTSPFVIIGSLAGDGQVTLGSRSLGIGRDDRSTTFAGIISGAGGLVKTGTGTLTLSGGNIYSGQTLISSGTLLVSNGGGSATGTGLVRVDAGSLGGTGMVGGAVRLGTGAGAGAVLAPGSNGVGTLTIQRALTFNGDGSYKCELDTNSSQADTTICKGATIANTATFEFLPLGNGILTQGRVFTLISNTAAKPISGTFWNLPDKAILTSGNNIFQASYEGGDGNDLTLTVIP
jgi:autotransporter-associated beta strand protein